MISGGHPGMITVSKFSRKIRSLRTIRHLSEDQLLPETGCPFCGSRSEREKVTVLQEAPDVFSLKCGSCHALSASRMPTQETLDAFYAQYYTHLDAGVTIDAPKTFAKYIFTLCRQLHGKRQLRILDYGGGNGTMAYLLAQQFTRAGAESVHILVIESHLRVPVETQPSVSIRIDDSIPEGGSPYDVVIASNVLDHIPEAGSVLRRLLEHMAPGGLLYARATYFEGLVRLAALFHAKLDLIYPEHVHDLGQFFWNGLFRHVFPDLAGNFSLLRSQPSKVETLFRVNPVRTLLAHMLKFPHRILGSCYTPVGGWEVLIHKKPHFSGKQR